MVIGHEYLPPESPKEQTQSIFKKAESFNMF